MEHLTDIVVDVETTHTNPAQGGIIQLAAIKCNLDTGEIGGTFDRCPMLLPFRHWSDGTKKFWRDRNELYMSFVARQEPAIPVFTDFGNWVVSDAPANGYRFWANHYAFDWGFVASHMEQCDLPMPFPFWAARDIPSFISGLHGELGPVDLGHVVPFNGIKHNALHDCAHEVDQIMYAKRRHVRAELIG